MVSISVQATQTELKYVSTLLIAESLMLKRTHMKRFRLNLKCSCLVKWPPTHPGPNTSLFWTCSCHGVATSHTHQPPVSGPECCWMLLDIALVRTFIVIMPQPGQRVKIRPGSIPPASSPGAVTTDGQTRGVCKPDVDAGCCQSKVARGAGDGQ